MSVKIVENNTLGRRYLPPTKSHPQGKWLEPGLNEVPELYFQELDSHVVVFKDLAGKEYDYFPGREALNLLLAPTKIADVAGILRFGPQITVYNKDQVVGDKAAWPHDLLGLKEPQALAFVTACTDSAVIKRWVAAGSKSEKVMAALRGKAG